MFAPTGTKDYSTYITKIRQSGADGVYLVLAGDDNNAFLAQAAQYQLPAKMAMLTETDRTGRVARRRRRFARPHRLGALLPSAIDNPKNKEFVELWKARSTRPVPDTFEGEQWQCMKVFEAGIDKAGGIEADNAASGDRGSDDRQHQGQGPDAQVRPPGRPAGLHGQSRQEGRLRHPMPEVIATLPAERTTPACNKMTYDD